MWIEIGCAAVGKGIVVAVKHLRGFMVANDKDRIMFMAEIKRGLAYARHPS